mmetsp:Transcript_23607/g.65333  ORF Transcript_23607/g.65333 Transcript_23607/m.65333 type:complete len:270 (+) Transcript_23607:1218-2027(+)
MPSEAAKNARMCLMKCRSPPVSLSQSLASCERSISSAVQNEASCFLYISQTCGYLMGNITHLCGLLRKSGSSFSSSLYSAEMRLTGAHLAPAESKLASAPASPTRRKASKSQGSCASLFFTTTRSAETIVLWGRPWTPYRAAKSLSSSAAAMVQWPMPCPAANCRAAARSPSTQTRRQRHCPEYSRAMLSSSRAAAGQALHQGAKKSRTIGRPESREISYNVVRRAPPPASATSSGKSAAARPMKSDGAHDFAMGVTFDAWVRCAEGHV